MPWAIYLNLGLIFREIRWLMTETVKFFLPNDEVISERRSILPWAVALGLLALLAGSLHRYDPTGTLGDIGILMGVLSALLFAGWVSIRRLPVVWLTPEGIFKIKPRGGRGNFRWNERMEVERDSESKLQGLLLWGEESADVDSRRRSVFGTTLYDRTPFRIPGFVLADPAFRAALLRWAPQRHPLFAYLPEAG